MTSTPPTVMTLIDQHLELKNDNNNVADSWQSNNELLKNFDFDEYFVDANMDMLFEGFYPYIEFFDEENVQPGKEESPDLAEPSTSSVLDSIMKVPSDLSAETSSKLSVLMCLAATGIVDSEGVCESKSFPNLLEAPISGLLDGTAHESVLVLKDPETSEVVDDEAIVSKPSEVEIEQSIIYVQHPLDSIIIDLTELSDEELAPLVTIGKVQKDQTSESQDNVSPTSRRTRQKTSFCKNLSDENVFLSSSIEDIEELFKENRQEMELVEKKRERLITLYDILLIERT